ncbi:MULTISPECIES: N-acetylmuramic acid 6-phosphate etherase [Agrobacterium]|uniref:N-acetylmuramic acid 6-phosphate etherase n=1 Tax=Agrobacterium rosae TaxID=1972867 RepID=A0A1R3TQM7_9HYPH|nr:MULTISPECIES: N-acetylmuramic acid 6-phosphate etherase [Agrobacterium]KAA3511435.1 N-acetylmuramic acid 6-phosphate etherase [Agrobacterium rosae]KAA3519141.1 N-acetylmuramic acid 6-phosphate etherase [Agrobacterium rosae]MBN7806960.1 N-acetylmuramic acid 6-phosphate etherase [Agrobacterium rosae]MCM2436219.1 N-acetylmuramic acid 6-phosphate etherase [Agrobacterium rosae]MDX8303867.1 N-acetylmuramic acid 6-phosphate etherase [Agrobacterium rosae]
MSASGTEGLHEKAKGLDTMVPGEILSLLSSGQQQAAQSVDATHDAIAAASTLAADAIAAGRKLVYAGAGSSGLMAMADALELPGTYGIAREQIAILFAGGASNVSDMPGAPEDDADQARKDAEAVIGAGDCVLAISASGSTPHALAVAAVARERGAKVVAVANNANATLFDISDVAILLLTPPEFVSGSTRMGAGTAQKIALNMFSTLMAIRLGHVHDGYMVNLRADNKKLIERAARIVSGVTGVDINEAGRLVEKASGSVKIAILLAAGAKTKDSAETMLAESGHNVRRALQLISG